MRFGMFSTMTGWPWGGSEELWSRAAHVLLSQGHEVYANVARTRIVAEPLQRLAQAGAHVRRRPKPLVGRKVRRACRQIGIWRHRELRWLRHTRPDFVLISVGYHEDDLIVAGACQALGVPYSIVVQAAGPGSWIHANDQGHYREAYRQARQVFCVCTQNREILEANLGLELRQAEIVDNPFIVRPDAAPPWPASDEPWRLACVARIDFSSKGQDVLLQVLRQPKWRARPLQIVLWGADCGSGQRARQLIDAFGLHGQVRFGGYANDIEALWAEHHGLVLPSRFEGNPLAMIEAMICGRVPIVTNVSRATELIDEGRSGFIAQAANVDSIDDALERAWQRRHEWQAMGAAAATAIRQRHSLQPAEDFARRLVEVARGDKRLRAAA